MIHQGGNAKSKPIREGLFHLPSSSEEQPYLVGSRCGKCGYVAFPKVSVCPMCVEGATMNEVPLSTRGRVTAFTVARVAPQGFKAPYIEAYVDLPEGPRVFTMITGCEPSEDALEVGREVELVIEKMGEDEEGDELIGYKFRPV